MRSDEEEQDEGGHANLGRARLLTEVRERLQEADRLAARDEITRAADLYDEAVGALLVLQGADRVGEMKSIDLRLEALRAALGSARAFSCLQDWPAAELRASRAIEAAMLGERGGAACRHAAELGLVASLGVRSTTSAPGDGACLMHRDAAAAFLLRARARLRCGDAVGAAEDSTMATSLAERFRDAVVRDVAQGILIQARMQLGCGGHGSRCSSGAMLPLPQTDSEAKSNADMFAGGHAHLLNEMD